MRDPQPTPAPPPGPPGREETGDYRPDDPA
jgi:hypothetical protein